ncbi:FkbM family methyltransferase [Clostridium sp.]|uniref:FkbM family methyltransferase n=1 Tax=Clostridium sp. TaxID=1506 RepID=UPI0026304571|nr:FkbM family methyltransferase [Clostridium sp.]
MCNLLEELIKENNFFYNSNKKNVIFGLGTTGKLIVDILQDSNFKIDYIVISDGYKVYSEYKNVRIYEMSHFPFNKEEYNILFTVKSYEDVLVDNLYQNGFENITFINSQKDYFKLLKIYYTQYFQKNNVDIVAKDIIKFKELNMVNPFLLNDELGEVFLSEIGDLILPIIMSDYSRIDEGAYEYNNVILEEDDIVFDCGANIGVFSSVAAFKKCIVYAFEPVPSTIEYLKKTQMLYPEAINICPYALADSEGYANFKVCDNANSENHMIDEDVIDKDIIKVKMTTIDKFVKENNIKRVDFIKADIEGAERFMLKGAQETLVKFAPKLSICTYHLKDDSKVLEDIIMQANPDYIIEHKWKKLYAYVPTKE